MLSCKQRSVRTAEVICGPRWLWRNAVYPALPVAKSKMVRRWRPSVQLGVQVMHNETVMSRCTIGNGTIASAAEAWHFTRLCAVIARHSCVQAGMCPSADCSACALHQQAGTSTPWGMLAARCAHVMQLRRVHGRHGRGHGAGDQGAGAAFHCGSRRPHLHVRLGFRGRSVWRGVHHCFTAVRFVSAIAWQRDEHATNVLVPAASHQPLLPV
jgi:hypothetical protein